MKKLLSMALVLMFTTTIYAQKDVTKFLGIPVDGYKPEMIQKLKAKGFVSSSYDRDILEGEFNGRDVNVHVVTNNNKVYRIMVEDANYSSETDIKIRFNKLCQQFANNSKYMSFGDYTISQDDDISYEMTVHNKRYQAAFYQQPDMSDTTALKANVEAYYLSKYTEEEFAALTEDEKTRLVFDYTFELLEKKSVWFMINEQYGRYTILMFYDNEYNKANGEEL